MIMLGLLGGTVAMGSVVEADRCRSGAAFRSVGSGDGTLLRLARHVFRSMKGVSRGPGVLLLPPSFGLPVWRFFCCYEGGTGLPGG